MYDTKMSMKQATMYADKVVAIGYCGLQYLLDKYERDGYNCGVYGWNCNIHRVYTTSGKLVVITTGYRNMRGTHPDIDTIERYNGAAKAISEYSSTAYIRDYDERKAALNALLDAFCREMCGEIVPDTTDIIRDTTTAAETA